jgi:hypothetical protein
MILYKEALKQSLTWKKKSMCIDFLLQILKVKVKVKMLIFQDVAYKVKVST